MFFNFKKSKKSGFSIIEVMVAVGLLAIIATGISSLLTSTMKQQKGIQAKDQQRDFTARVRTLLNNKTACLNSMGGKLATGAGEPVDPLKDEAGNTKFQVGDLDNSKMLKITGMRVWSADTSIPTQITALFQVFLTKTDDKTGTANAIRPDILTLRVKLDGANKITECFSIGTNSDGLWQISPYNTSDIYYSAGKVGIGTDKPDSPLEIVFDNQPADYRNDLLITRYNNNNDWSPINFRRFRGTPSAPSNVQTNDDLGGIIENVYLGALPLPSVAMIKTVYRGDGISTLSSEMQFAVSGLLTDPQMKLNQSGNLILKNNSNPTVLEIQEASAGGHRWGFGSFGTLAGYPVGGFGIGDWTASAWRMMIDAGGNVGIGTTAPGGTLHVAGSANANSILIQPNSMGAGQTSKIRFADPDNGTTPVDIIYTDSGSPTLAIMGGAGIAVGIGTTSPSEALHVAGNVQGDAFYWSSDARLKNILSVSPGLEMINKITGYSFEWKKNGKKDLGFMAQEIEKLLPELVTTDSSGFKHLSYTGIVPVLVEAVKELDEKNKKLEARLEALEKKLNSKVK